MVQRGDCRATGVSPQTQGSSPAPRDCRWQLGLRLGGALVLARPSLEIRARPGEGRRAVPRVSACRAVAGHAALPADVRRTARAPPGRSAFPQTDAAGAWDAAGVPVGPRDLPGRDDRARLPRFDGQGDVNGARSADYLWTTAFFALVLNSSMRVAESATRAMT